MLSHMPDWGWTRSSGQLRVHVAPLSETLRSRAGYPHLNIGRAFWMIYRGQGFLTSRLLPSPLSGDQDRVVTFSIFLWVAIELIEGEGGKARSLHTTARMPSLLLIIQYSMGIGLFVLPFLRGWLVHVFCPSEYKLCLYSTVTQSSRTDIHPLQHSSLQASASWYTHRAGYYFLGAFSRTTVAFASLFPLYMEHSFCPKKLFYQHWNTKAVSKTRGCSFPSLSKIMWGNISFL